MGLNGRETEGQRDRGSLHLLVWLHLAANNSEGVGSGVVVDLHAAEGLGTSASREPSLVAVIIKHHSSPAGTDNRLTAGGRAEGPVTFSMSVSPGHDKNQRKSLYSIREMRMEESDILSETQTECGT